MLAAFWEGVQGKLVDRWSTLAAPALVFWLGGLLAYAYHRGDIATIGQLPGELGVTDGPSQLLLLGVALVLVLASSLLVDQLTTPVLRLMEGYWPHAATGLKQHLLDRLERKAAAEDARWQALAPVLADPGKARRRDRDEAVKLDQQLRRRPHPSRFMPTTVGNILRAAEDSPRDKYGLDPVVTWPALWLVIPVDIREVVADARTSLDRAAGAVVWGIAFTVFVFWAWWALLVALLTVLGAARWWVPARAAIFGDALNAVYDTHRRRLYEATRWPLPKNPADEHVQGQSLTEYLWRGSDAPLPTFDS